MTLFTCQQASDPVETWKVFETWEEAHEEYDVVSKFYTTYLIKSYPALELIAKLKNEIFELKGK